MAYMTRREFLTTASATAAAIAGIPTALNAFTKSRTIDKYVTCFYQFGNRALEFLSGTDGLINGPQYLHVFSKSMAGDQEHPEIARKLHSMGTSFKYAHTFDLSKYNGWRSANNEQLQYWSTDFRRKALTKDGQADFFALNEMPNDGATDPTVQRQIAKLVQFLYQSNDGLPSLKGVIFLTEQCTNPQLWRGDFVDRFWSVLNETCELIVGEHYHNSQFILSRSPEEYSAYLSAMPKWLDLSGKLPQQHIARYKYTLLHSSYYGPFVTGWEGILKNNNVGASDVSGYLQRVVHCTRQSMYGHFRIAFAPLADGAMDQEGILPQLASILHRDALSHSSTNNG